MDNKALHKATMLLDAYFNEELPEELSAKIRTWIAQEGHDEEKYAAMHRIWETKFPCDSAPDRNVLESYDRISRLLNFPMPGDKAYKAYADGAHDPSVVRPGAPKRSLWKRSAVFRFAAVLLPAIALAGAGWLWLAQPDTAQATQRGQVAQVVVAVPDTLGAQGRRELPDGSNILVRPGGTVSHAEDFMAQRERRVYLSGEAYFSVEHDVQRPFIVETAHLSVRVLGTKFNVEAYAGRPVTIVSLYQGSVELETETSKKTTLSPGNRLIYNNISGEYSVEPIDGTVPAWVSVRMDFDNTPLDQVLCAIGWYYGVEVEAPGNLMQTDERITFRYSGIESLTEAMDLLARISQTITGYRIEAGKVTVTTTNTEE